MKCQDANSLKSFYDKILEYITEITVVCLFVCCCLLKLLDSPDLIGIELYLASMADRDASTISFPRRKIHPRPPLVTLRDAPRCAGPMKSSMNTSLYTRRTRPEPHANPLALAPLSSQHKNRTCAAHLKTQPQNRV